MILVESGWVESDARAMIDKAPATSIDGSMSVGEVMTGLVFFFKQKTAYEITVGLEFRRVLFRSSQQRCSWHRAAGSQSFDRKTAGCKEGQEGVTQLKENHGTKNTSIRIPPRLQQALEIALVRWSRLCRTASRRREAAQGIEREAEVSRHQLHRNRTRSQQTGGAHFHRPARDHHRPQGRGNRQAQAGRAEAHQARSAHRHPGSASPGTGCHSGRGIDCAATGKAGGLSPRHAQIGRLSAAIWLQGNQSTRCGTFERRGNRPERVVSARPFAAADPSRGHRLWYCRSADHLRRHRGEVLDLSGRKRSEAQYPGAGKARGGGSRLKKLTGNFTGYREARIQ